MDPVQDSVEATLALIRRAQAGEHEALEEVFARYYAPVRAYVRRRLGRGLRLEVESMDIMQETFLLAVERFDQFEVRSEAGLINWLSTIAENRIKALARRTVALKRDRGRQVALQQLRESLAEGAVRVEPEARISLPGVQCERRELEALLELAMDQLQPELRDVILHRTVGGATWPQVAELMGRGSETSARKLHAKAMAALSWKLGAGAGE